MRTFRRSRPDEQGAIVQLLKSAYDDGLPAGLFSPELWHWKFFDPRASAESRSHILVDGERIEAHIAEWPVSFQTSAGEVRSSHFIDWVTRPEARGAGVGIFLRLREQHDTAIAIGGSEHARQLRPGLGFQPYGSVNLFARVVRPWRQFRVRPGSAGLRDYVRLGRNFLWSRGGPQGLPAGWAVSPATDPGEVPESALRTNPSDFCAGVRSAEWLRYLMDCPAMNCSLFVLSKDGRARGYVLLNQCLGQCRIADLAVDSAEHADWVAAYQAAAFVAAQQKETCEITAASSLPWLSEGLKVLGFRQRGEIPVTIYDPKQLIVGGPPLLFRMTDNDYCFLYSESFPFLT